MPRANYVCVLIAVLVAACSTVAEKNDRLAQDGGNAAPSPTTEPIDDEPEDQGEPGEPTPPDGGVSDGRVPDAQPPSGEYVAISSGRRFSCALMRDSTVRCWGAAEGVGEGALPFPAPEICVQQPGCPDQPCSRLPRTVPGLTGVVDVTIGIPSGNAMIMADGTVRVWGGNEWGMLGLGTDPRPRSTPTTIPGLTNVRQITIGEWGGMCARIADGTVKCWGLNQDGQLGFASTEYCDAAKTQPWCTFTPTTVPGVSGATQVTSGEFSVCALIADGTVKCWGSLVDEGGELRKIPPTTMPDLGNVAELADGSHGSAGCARLRDGAVVCWTVDQPPTPVSGIGGSAIEIARRGGIACARRSDRKVMCWGNNQLLGTALSSTPKEVPELTTSRQFQLLGIGQRGWEVCYVRDDGGSFRCDRNPNCAGQRGDGTSEPCSCDEG